MDLWSLLLRRVGVPTIDYAMFGRWCGHWLTCMDPRPSSALAAKACWRGSGLANSGASRQGLRAGRQGRACLRPAGDEQPGAVRPAEFTAAPPGAHAASSPGTGPRTVSRPRPPPARLLKNQYKRLVQEPIQTSCSRTDTAAAHSTQPLPGAKARKPSATSSRQDKARTAPRITYPCNAKKKRGAEIAPRLFYCQA
jgi:hypothetical protein